MVVASLNIGSMIGRSGEVVDLMIKKRIDVLCLRGTEWKGNKTRVRGEECKIFYAGNNGKRNGVGIVLRGF